MPEIAKPESQMTEVEVSLLPEVDNFATALTTLFKDLGVPEEQYAIRVGVPKSLVSRYLRGRRVAPQDFADRMLSEVEAHRGVELKGEARARVHRLRMEALRVSDARSYELETLREKVSGYQREIKRMKRQGEALELLLDQREQEAHQREYRLAELEGDARSQRIEGEATVLALRDERNRIKDEGDELREEIAQLKHQLAELRDARDSAESECRRLQERLFTAEAKLAQQTAATEEDLFFLTLEELQSELIKCAQESRLYEQARQLSQAAARLSSEDILALARWLQLREWPYELRQLIQDTVRFRPLDFVMTVVERIFSDPLLRQLSLKGIEFGMSARTHPELREFYERWSHDVELTRLMRTPLFSRVGSEFPIEVIETLKSTRRTKDSTTRVKLLYRIGEQEPEWVVAVMAECVKNEWFDDALVVLTACMARGNRFTKVHTEYQLDSAAERHFDMKADRLRRYLRQRAGYQ